MNIDSTRKFFTPKLIFIILGVVIGAELIWAGWSLVKSSPAPSTPPTVSLEASSSAQISLVASSHTVKVGEKISVNVNIYSPKKVDGVDLIINFDPNRFVLETGDNPKNAPLAPSNTFSDYPINSVDLTTGKITVSGIASQSGGILQNGLFGTIILRAKAVGKTAVSLDFSPGSTKDTNVIESGSGLDLLDKVNNLELTITP